MTHTNKILNILQFWPCVFLFSIGLEVENFLFLAGITSLFWQTYQLAVELNQKSIFDIGEGLPPPQRVLPPFRRNFKKFFHLGADHVKIYSYTKY